MPKQTVMLTRKLAPKVEAPEFDALLTCIFETQEAQIRKMFQKEQMFELNATRGKYPVLFVTKQPVPSTSWTERLSITHFITIGFWTYDARSVYLAVRLGNNGVPIEVQLPDNITFPCVQIKPTSLLDLAQGKMSTFVNGPNKEYVWNTCTELQRLLYRFGYRSTYSASLEGKTTINGVEI